MLRDAEAFLFETRQLGGCVTHALGPHTGPCAIAEFLAHGSASARPELICQQATDVTCNAWYQKEAGSGHAQLPSTSDGSRL